MWGEPRSVLEGLGKHRGRARRRKRSGWLTRRKHSGHLTRRTHTARLTRRKHTARLTRRKHTVAVPGVGTLDAFSTVGTLRGINIGALKAWGGWLLAAQWMPLQRGRGVGIDRKGGWAGGVQQVPAAQRTPLQRPPPLRQLFASVDLDRSHSLSLTHTHYLFRFTAAALCISGL